MLIKGVTYGKSILLKEKEALFTGKDHKFLTQVKIKIKKLRKPKQLIGPTLKMAVYTEKNRIKTINLKKNIIEMHQRNRPTF